MLPFDQLLHRGVAEVIVEEELRRKLASGQRLRLKQGFDPSRPDLHLGHAVGLRKLRQFQELGHQVVLIVGDWTAQIGDPSGASATRPMLSAEEVEANAQSYLEQFFRIVDPKLTEVRRQSEWYSNFKLDEVLRLTSRFTLAQMLAREDFGNRMEAGSPIAVTELLYPLLQAYDSVVVRADVEFGGIDQKFNCLLGRELQRMVGQAPQDVFLVPLLVGTDGQRKMSKSYDNYIGIAEPPEEQYGKVMSLPDELIIPYFEMVTDVPEPELRKIAQALEGGGNPRDHKMRLGREIVAQFHGAQAAQAAEEEFRRVFQERQLPSEIPTFAVLVTSDGVAEEDLMTVLVKSGLVPSRSEARRLIVAGAVDILDNVSEARWRTERDPNYRPRPDEIIRVGKRRFLRLVSSPSED